MFRQLALGLSLSPIVRKLLKIAYPGIVSPPINVFLLGHEGTSLEYEHDVSVTRRSCCDYSTIKRGLVESLPRDRSAINSSNHARSSSTVAGAAQFGETLLEAAQAIGDVLKPAAVEHHLLHAGGKTKLLVLGDLADFAQEGEVEYKLMISARAKVI